MHIFPSPVTCIAIVAIVAKNIRDSGSKDEHSICSYAGMII